MSALARTTDPATSHEAAAAVTPELTRLEQLCLNALTVRDMTVSEIAKWTDVERDTLSPRITNLVRRKLVEDTGTKRVPEGKRRRQIVWRKAKADA